MDPDHAQRSGIRPPPGDHCHAMTARETGRGRIPWATPVVHRLQFEETEHSGYVGGDGGKRIGHTRNPHS